jgi:hypothetical protein
MLNELYSEYGKGISFIDIDETLYNTFARIYVIKDGKTIKKLSNQEFNTYKLQPGESFDFREFIDANFFYKTSKPIYPTINRIKRIFQNIERRGSKVVLLTARETFDDMKKFASLFKKHGIPYDKTEKIFVGDRPDKRNVSISQAKKKAVLKYLSTGEYRRCRLIDDDMTNIQKFLSIQNELPQEIINKVKAKHNIPEDENFPVIQFFGLLVLPNGKLQEIK